MSNTNTTTTYDPMNPTAGVGGVPPGTYNGKFKVAEYQPATEGDPMTGKGKRQYAGVKFVWELDGGEFAGKSIALETTTATGSQSGQFKVWGWLTGKTVTPGEKVNLTACVDKRYLITVGTRPNKQWVEVTNAVRLPGQ